MVLGLRAVYGSVSIFAVPGGSVSIFAVRAVRFENLRFGSVRLKLVRIGSVFAKKTEPRNNPGYRCFFSKIFLGYPELSKNCLGYPFIWTRLYLFFQSVTHLKRIYLS